MSYSLRHNGASGEVDLGTTEFNFDRTDSFSVVMWVHPVPGGLTQALIGRRASSGSFDGWEFLVNSYRPRVVLQRNGVSKIQVTCDKRIDKDRVYHLGFAYGGTSFASDVDIYIDGVLQPLTINQDNLTDSIQSLSATTSIGARNAAANRFNGSVSEVIVYNRKLTAEEFTAIVNDGKYPNDIPYAQFLYQEGSGSTLNDSSGNGRDGTISGLSWSNRVPYKARTTASSRVLANGRTPIT